MEEMSALSLRESPEIRDLDHSANAVKQSIESIQSSSPEKFTWLDLFASFRILRNLYANPETEASGLRLLGWSNLFDTLYQNNTEPPQQPANPQTASSDDVFNTQSLEQYANDVLQVLVDEAYDILNMNGSEDNEISEVEGLFEEVRRDFQCMLDIQRVGHQNMERQYAELTLETENLVGAMGELGLEFSDPVQEMNAMVGDMGLQEQGNGGG